MPVDYSRYAPLREYAPEGTSLQDAIEILDARTLVSVKELGAKGDGRDDAPAIQRAIDAAGAYGVTLLPPLPSGQSYRCLSGLTLSQPGAMLVGFGVRSLLLADYAGATPFITVGSAAARTSDQVLTDLACVGGSVNRPDTTLRLIRTTNVRARGLTGTQFKLSFLDLQSVWESYFYDLRAQLIGESSTTTSGVIWLHPDAGSGEAVNQNHFAFLTLGSTIGTVFRLDGGASPIAANHFTSLVAETYPSGGPYASDATAQLVYLDNAVNNKFSNFSFNVNSRANAQSAYAIESSGTHTNRGNVFSNGTLAVSKFGVQTNVPTGFARTSRGSLWFTNVVFTDLDNLVPNNQFLKVDTGTEPDLFHRIHLRDCSILTDKTYSQLFADPAFILGSFSTQQVAGPFATKQFDQRFLAKDVTAYPSAGTGETNLAQVAINNYAIGYTNGLRIHAAGNITGAAGTKTIKLYFDLQTITLLNAVATTSDWRLEAEVLWSGNANWVVSWVFYNGATIAGQGCTPLTEATVAYPIKLTGQCSNGADAITQKIFVVERMDQR